MRRLNPSMFLNRQMAREANRRERTRIKRPRTHIPKSRRASVLAAGKCAICGSTGPLHVDHRIALARGGDSHPSNLQALCARCNLMKGAYGTNEIIAARIVRRKAAA